MFLPECWQVVPAGVSSRLPVVVFAVPDVAEPPVVFVFLILLALVSSVPVAVTFPVDVCVAPPVSSTLFAYQHHKIQTTLISQ